MDCLSAFFDHEDIKKEWFCVIIEIVHHQRMCSVEELATYISGTGCISCGEYVFGPTEIPVRARTTDDWIAVIEEMIFAGLALIISESERHRIMTLYYNTCAALRPFELINIGEVWLTEAGYQYWDRYRKTCLTTQDPGVAAWDIDEHLLVFQDGIEKLKDSCPVRLDGCPVCIFEGEPQKSIETGEQGEMGCTIHECGPFWIDKFAVCQRGYKLKCIHRRRTEDDPLLY